MAFDPRIRPPVLASPQRVHPCIYIYICFSSLADLLGGMLFLAILSLSQSTASSSAIRREHGTPRRGPGFCGIFGDFAWHLASGGTAILPNAHADGLWTGRGNRAGVFIDGLLLFELRALRDQVHVYGNGGPKKEVDTCSDLTVLHFTFAS